MEMATAFFQERLQSPDGAEARAYLREPRPDPGHAAALPPRLCARQPQCAQGASSPARASSKAQIEACGLVVFGDDVPVSYDRFRDRVMFPIPDSRGAIIAFGGRALSADAPAKYLNSPETELFHKGNVLYNFAPRPQGAAEGRHGDRRRRLYGRDRAGAGGLRERRCAARHGARPKTSSSCCGGWSAEPVLCFDGDQAGLKAAWRAADLALPLIQPGRTVRFALLPEGKDPDDLVQAERRRRRSAPCSPRRGRSPICCGCARRRAAVFDTPEQQGRPRKALRELTARIRDESLRYHYARRCASRVQAFFGRRSAAPRAAAAGRADAPATGTGRPIRAAARRPGASPSRKAWRARRWSSAAGGVMPLREATHRRGAGQPSGN